MADRSLSPAAPSSALAAWPWWARVIAIFAASRVVTTVILLSFSAAQPATTFSPAHPDYSTMVTQWDGAWYFRIAAGGYPTTLPLDAAGHVAENAWAFLPAYPFLVRALATVTFLPYPVVAAAVSIGCALGAALLLHRILVRSVPAGQALFAVALFCFGPLSPILQVGYAEPMALLLLALGLLLVLQRRYAWAIPVVVVLGFTRPIAFAFALFLLLHLVQRIRGRRAEPFPVRQLGGVIALGLVSAAVGASWPLIAWAVTGSRTAYTDTELVWRSGYIGDGELLPFASWFQGADYWLRFLGMPSGAAEVLGIIAVVALVAVFVLLLLLPATRRLAGELRLWVLSWGVYLLAVFFPQSSTFRLLMPMFPLLGAVAPPRSRLARAGMLVGCVLLQIGWVYIDWWVMPYDWSPP